MSRHVLSLLVENKPGLLTRVAGLFARRGFNIESLAVGKSEIEGLSRITVVVDVEDDRERGRRLEREGGDASGARRGQVVLTDPAVRAPVESTEGADLPLGDPVRATLREASVAERRVRFTVG